MNTLEDEFAHGIRLRDLGDTARALEVFSRVSNRPDATAPVFAVLGDLQWDLGALEGAILSFRRATELAPKWEAASVGLYHVLCESGRIDDAFDEMRRFLAIGTSVEYPRLLSELLDGAEEGNE